MKTPTIGPVNRQALTKQITDLDVQINKVVKWINAKDFKSGSLMLSGKSVRDKEFHELMVWSPDLPLPRELLVAFLNQYGQNLIAYRNILVEDLQTLGTEQPVTAGQLITKTLYCPRCNKVTKTELRLFNPDDENSAFIVICFECEEGLDIVEIK